jgi:membrane peptidoglycan carboxypeptidase
MEGALSQSVNTVAAEVIIKTGIENVISTARELGIETDLPKVPSLALGVASMSLKELLFAYATMLMKELKQNLIISNQFQITKGIYWPNLNARQNKKQH